MVRVSCVSQWDQNSPRILHSWIMRLKNIYLTVASYSLGARAGYIKEVKSLIICKVRAIRYLIIQSMNFSCISLACLLLHSLFSSLLPQYCSLSLTISGIFQILIRSNRYLLILRKNTNGQDNFIVHISWMDKRDGQRSIFRPFEIYKTN